MSYKSDMLRRAITSRARAVFVRSDEPRKLAAVRDMVDDGLLRRGESSMYGTYYNVTQAGYQSVGGHGPGPDFEPVDGLQKIGKWEKSE
jgi:hypothetical protein